MKLNTKEEILNELESIARGDGDETLNIKDWYNKMCTEIEMYSNHFKGNEEVAKINHIPIEIVEGIEKLGRIEKD